MILAAVTIAVLATVLRYRKAAQPVHVHSVECRH